MSCLPDYSKGYPQHVQHSTHPRCQRLVRAGYQDSVCVEEKVSQLGRHDHHKKGLYHSAHHCVGQPKGRIVRLQKC